MKLWIRWMILGVLSLLFGLFVLANPVAASVAVTFVAGVTFALLGAAQAYAGFTANDKMSRAMGLGLGAVMLLLGLSLMFRPLEGILSLATIATVLIGLNGVLRLTTAWRMKDTPMFWPMLISGAASVLLAGYILANFFEVAPQLLGILLGVELLFNGAGLIALAVFLRSAGDALRDKIEKKFEK